MWTEVAEGAKVGQAGRPAHVRLVRTQNSSARRGRPRQGSKQRADERAHREGDHQLLCGMETPRGKGGSQEAS